MILSEKFWKKATYFIYISFAFDSLLKINLGVKIHLGVLVIFFLNILYFVTIGWRKKFKIHKLDIWLAIFTIYIFISGLTKVGSSSLFVFSYLFLALNVYFFIKQHFKHLNQKLFIHFQIILITTGLLQFIFFKIFHYQFDFLGDGDYYIRHKFVSTRLRGFFVEPNWYSIAIIFNTFLLFKNDVYKFFKEHTLLVILSFFVSLVNGSFGTLAILLAFYSYYYLKRSVFISLFVIVVGGFIFSLILQQRTAKKGKKGIEMFNYYSRTEPINRVTKYMKKQPSEIIWFGEGFGSWGTKATKHMLSVLNYKQDPKSRDGSELPVFIFELGIIGTLIFLFDFLYLLRKSYNMPLYIKGALTLFLISFLLYPIFKFLMYMVYYFVFRQLIINKNKQIILE